MVRSTRKPVSPAELNAFVLNAYPEDNLETAVQKYVIENWIKWAKFKMNGVRYIIAEDILYFRDKGLCITKLLEGETNDRNRFRSAGDRSYGQGQRSCSESLETQERRPVEYILDNIFKHALVALPGTVVSPNLLATNRKKRYIEPSHKINVIGQDFEPYYSDNGHRPLPYNPAYFDNSHVSFKRRTLRDKKGKEFFVHRSMQQSFEPANFYTKSDPYCYIDKTHFVLAWQVKPRKRVPPHGLENGHLDQNQAKLGSTKSQFPKPSSNFKANPSSHKFRDGATMIPSFVFFTTLGYKLRFEGTIKAHECSRNTCRLQCDDAFITSMKCYISLINTFCSGLHELTLEVHVDHWGALPSPAGRQVEFNEIFAQFLKNDIRELKIVRVLQVVAAKPPSDHYQKADVSIARDTIQWFEERETARV
ncbi:uncharacterized protein EAE97_010203 [Botrytis byssoidea]|uniref:Uncharacterized protein n=1 Tax=Botrytis byssoidea TaxID=139641 RepID=A0A9P5I8N3_9HELO|nr:uncharacterized protein EAE97_010203 [Botrytis byssoidea]KAF7926694.1 hypothetical protein EAE97_010203 [Botrytis byssoidea]